jgi:2-oxoacid:acceptor oxidoreductase delta subunit (pyruvate/2-ketoisovalerate family)
LSKVVRAFRPVVDNDVCVRCYNCQTYCPEGTVMVKSKEEGVIYDYRFCTGCGICANECPVEAIKMVREP